MRRFLKVPLMTIAAIALGACVVLFPLDPEESIFNPPRFRREYCVPAYSQSVVIDSKDYETIRMVVEDYDINDNIEFRIFKDYYQCTDSASCKLKLLTESSIPPSTSDASELGIYTRTFEYPIKRNLLCSSSAGDSLGSSHIIEVVITDTFVNDSDMVPYWRKGVASTDVWSFIVNCVDSGLKSNDSAKSDDQKDTDDGQDAGGLDDADDGDDYRENIE